MRNLRSKKNRILTPNLKHHEKERDLEIHPGTMKKKETWKFILQTLLSVLSAIATAFGVASCIAG